ncbi:hypothetical protein BG46_07520 [Brucella anthropi]|nr:hypothetical protein BG46_07520 [Brucella anthropi]
MKSPAHIFKPVAFERCEPVTHTIGDSIDSRHCKCAFSHVETNAVCALEAMQKRDDDRARSRSHIEEFKRVFLHRKRFQRRNDQLHQHFRIGTRFKRSSGEPERQTEELANTHDPVNRLALFTAVQRIGKRLDYRRINQLLRCGYQIEPRLAGCPFDQKPCIEVWRIQFCRTKPRPCISHQAVETHFAHP